MTTKKKKTKKIEHIEFLGNIYREEDDNKLFYDKDEETGKWYTFEDEGDDVVFYKNSTFEEEELRKQKYPVDKWLKDGICKRCNDEEMLKKAMELDKEGAIRENKKLLNMREINELEEQLKKDIEKSKEKFNDKDLLLNIKLELDKDHKGDAKGKMFLFCSSCSSQLRPEYRFSTALTGYSSEGKTNTWNTIKRHLSKKWYLDLTRITGSAIEDDIKEVNLIYFGEGNFDKGSNAPIIDHVKQLVEDGVRVKKKDTRTGFKEARYEEQPRKVGIYSTTKDSSDEELSTRYCIASVHGSPKKYKMVNEDTKTTASDIDKEIDKTERNETYTWIQLGLDRLKSYDFITIPYAPLLEVECRDARSQRDLKRFLNLIRVIAWICQYNRIQFEHRGYNILVASPEDFYNAMEIGKEIFDQSLSGIEPRLKKIIDSYKKFIKERTDVIKRFDDEEEDLQWIDRSLIQKDLGIKSRDTIKEHTKKLCDMNIFTYLNKGSRSYVAFKFHDSPTNLPTNYPLITNDKKQLYKVIKDNYQLILKERLVGSSLVDLSEKTIIKSSLLSLENDLPTKKVKKHTKKGILERLRHELEYENEKLVGKNSSVEKEKPLSQYDKIQEMRKIIEENRKAGFKINIDFLFNNFDHGTVNGLIESGQLIKQGNEEYVFGGN